MSLWGMGLLAMQATFNERLRSFDELNDIPTCCDKAVTTKMIETAIKVKPMFKPLTNRDICFVLMYNYYWVEYPDTRVWLTREFFEENIKESNRVKCEELIDHLRRLYGGFDIIVIISLHAGTCDVEGNPFRPMRFTAASKAAYEAASKAASEAASKAASEAAPEAEPYSFTLMEAVPCGITNFNMVEDETATILEHIKALKSEEHFLEELQSRLRQLKPEKLKGTDFVEFIGTPDYVMFEECTDNFNIVPHKGGYLERVYQYDRTEPGTGFNVAFATGVFKTGDNLMDYLTPLTNKRKPEFNRTQLLTLLRDHDYIKPLIIDITCGGFDDVPDDRAKHFMEEAKKNGYSGGKSRHKRHLKKRTRKGIFRKFN